MYARQLTKNKKKNEILKVGKREMIESICTESKNCEFYMIVKVYFFPYTGHILIILTMQ